MNCPLCKGEIEKGFTTFTADLKDVVVVVRNVPATVCSLCGEEWIDDAVSQELEDIVLEAKNKHRLFEVVEYQKKVA